jgi:hypothetical protein
MSGLPESGQGWAVRDPHAHNVGLSTARDHALTGYSG